MLLERHRSKIVQPSQLPALLGPRPRERSVVMCCGVFDVVHPGHLRHLLYAKSKADILVAAVTGDAHVPKGPHRPHVPQDLRAANLSVYDFVDYVVISDSPSINELLVGAQPDFYAKGFEYSRDARAKPIAEVAIVEGYGGQVIYTPGDVVYSSSALIEASAPDLRYEKLEMLMRRLDISFDGLRSTVAQMVGQRVHVVGDTIVDSLQYCEMIGAQAKTPTISVRRERREDFVGGAGVVAKHMRAAGADVHFTTVLGGDHRAVMVLDDLAAAGIRVDHVVDMRPTTCKEAIVVGGYRLLKIDDVDNRSIAGSVLDDVRRSIAEVEAAAVIFSDFRHGIFNARTIPELSAAIRPDTQLRVADSQVASRWGNITEFSGFDLITPNEREARFALADQDSGVRPLAARLHREARCKWLLMKMGQHGVLGFGNEPEDSIAVDSFAKSAADPVGAGDAFLSYATLAMLAGGSSLAQAAILGTFAAGAECERDGNIPISPEYVLSKIDEAEREIG